MSFISMRNLVAPITNVGHLIAILVVSLAFGMYRMLGGAVHVRDLSAPKSGFVEAHQPSAPASSRSHTSALGSNTHHAVQHGTGTADNRVRPRAPRSPAKAGSNTDFLSSMLGSSSRKEAKPVEKKVAPVAPPDNSLDDIEKTLGLR